MNPKNAQNTLNLILRKTTSFTGDEFPELLEIIRDLQVDINANDQPTANAESGTEQAPPDARTT